MRIALTGANGFTGRHFVKQAEACGHEIWLIKSRLGDYEGLVAEFSKSGADAVVHLAAISFVGHKDISAFYDLNVIGTENVLKAILATQKAPRQVLIASSANIYGAQEQSPISETAIPHPVNHYAISKLAMEFVVRTYSDQLPITITRPFNYTGVGQSENFVIPKIVSHFKERAPSISLGNIDVDREFNDVRMICEAMLRLIDGSSAFETVNLCTGRAYSLGSILERLTMMTGHEMNVEVNPLFVRANEIPELYGDPTRLKTLIGDLPRYTIDDTLAWMLEMS